MSATADSSWPGDQIANCDRLQLGPGETHRAGERLLLGARVREDDAEVVRPDSVPARQRCTPECLDRETLEDMPSKGWETHWHLHPGVRSGEELTLGERAADRMRNMMGSWPFVFTFFGVMAAWVLVNTLFIEHVLHHKPFDPYPYILLNLFLSMLAGVQAAALLIAAKREDAISSEIALHTEHNTDDIKKLISENTELTAQVKRATDLLA